MSLHASAPNKFTYRVSNLTGRITTTWGTSVTPAQNSFAQAWTQILAATTADTYFMEISVNGIGASGTSKDALLNIGIDHSGGTTYTDNSISNLLVSHAAVLVAGGGLRYRFPLFVPSGSTIAAKVSTNNVTVGNAYIGITLWGNPTKPELVRAGSYITTFGATTATSSGTTISAGTTNEGTWTSLGTDISSNYWWWQAGWGAQDLSLTSVMYTMDIGVGTSNSVVDPIFQDQVQFNAGTSENPGRIPSCDHEYVHEVAGDGATDVWGRLQCSGTADSNLSMCAYGLGG